MIVKTIKAISLGIKGGYKITHWALKEDIEALKKGMDKSPVKRYPRHCFSDVKEQVILSSAITIS